MKILIVRNSNTIINLNNYNVQELGLATSFVKNNNEVGIVFYTNGDYKEVNIDNVKIYYIPGKIFLNYVVYNDIIYSIIENYDIVQCSEYNQIMSYKLLKKYGNNKVLIYHGPYYRDKLRTKINNLVFDLFYLKKYLKLNPCFISKSELAKEFLEKKGFNNIHVLGVGLNNKKLNEKKENNEFKNTLQNDSIKLLNVATIEKRKNTLFLLQILNELVKVNSHYILYLIGKPKIEYKNKCLQYIRKNNLEKNVVFINSVNQNELAYIYNNIDYYLFPSNYEIFGMVLLEAMYFNKKIISSLNGGSSYLLNENSIINEFNVEKWVNKIINGENLNIYKNKKIIWDDISEDFLNVYNEIMIEKNT